ncbi:MAG TPA: molybdopterin-dependent oxidoreductase [Desulfatiglandales bacterium]|nr:molybdopterin-dependent oxidoreductase [Desulfatiglandales bacterium]
MEPGEKGITDRLGMNRRNFIKLIVGGAVGTALSPLPWKLIDDIAIWTQNLPWVPVPPVGEYSYARSVCLLCPGGCGIKVLKVDDRAVKIEGRTDYPVNPGGICPLGMGGLQLLYNERTRFTSPMKRVGVRGSDTFQAISWDDALDIFAERLSGLRDNGRIRAFAAIDGNLSGSTISVMIERFLKALGSPNYVRIPSSQDTDSTAAHIMMGRQLPFTYDLENSDYILSFGSGLLEGWGAPGRVINAWALWRSGDLKDRVQVIQIESRASSTASKADRWIPAKPGTDAALALGISHVIIQEALYDAGFVEKYSYGFDNFRSADGIEHKGFKTLVLENYSPEKVERITGVDAHEIRLIARDFANAAAPIAICGRGKGALYGSLYESMSVLSLNALVGGINRSGGIFIHEPFPLAGLPDPRTDSATGDALAGARMDNAGSGGYPFSISLLNNLADSILKAGESPIDTILVSSSNPAFTIPDGGRFRSALEKIPFIVSLSPYRDETALLADLILPDHTHLEKIDDIAWPAGLQYPLYGLSTPVVEPLYDTRSSGDVILGLTKKVGGQAAEAFPWSDYEEVLKTRVKGLFDTQAGRTSYDGSGHPWERFRQEDIAPPGYNNFDEMWDRIKENGMWYRPGYPVQESEGLFKTASGRFEFYSGLIDASLKGVDLKALGIKASGDEVCIPHYEKASLEEDKIFPLRMCPYELINLSSGWLPNPPYLNKTLFDDQLKKGQSFLEINPDTAEEYDLRQGDSVFVESPKGRIRALVNVFEGAMPGIVFMPMGLGHSAYDDFLRDKGSNPNEIIHGGIDPLSGQTIWWDTPVRLVKA